MRGITRIRGVGRLTLLAATAALAGAVAPAAALAGPEWQIDAYSTTSVAPGAQHQHLITLSNVGDAPMDGSPFKARVDLPTGLVAKTADLFHEGSFESFPCQGGADGSLPVEGATTIICESSHPLPALSEDWAASVMRLRLTSEALSGAELGTRNTALQVEGGGAAATAWADPVTIAPVPPPFGFDAFDNILRDEAGGAFTQAGGHPQDIVTSIDFNTRRSADPMEGAAWPIAAVKDAEVELPPGLVGNPEIATRCSAAQLSGFNDLGNATFCPSAAQVGTVVVRARPEIQSVSLVSRRVPLFNLEPPVGAAARFGFNYKGTLIAFDARLSQGGEYRLNVASRNTPQAFGIAGTTVTFWGLPSSEAHRGQRACPGANMPWEMGETCPAGGAVKPFLRMPTACTDEGIETHARIASWADPGEFVETSSVSHQPLGYPYQPIEWGEEAGITGCEKVPLDGDLDAQPTSLDTETSSGLEVHLEVPNSGLENPTGIASSDLRKVRVTLPQGVTINPSQAEGLGTCSLAAYESTELTLTGVQGGCPSNSKIGTVEVETPLLEETIPGDVFVAQPDDPSTTAPGAENPFDSLLAIYIVLAEPQRGILVKLPGEVTTDESTGRIVTTFDDLPQQPFDSFDFKFREGARAPLVTPPTCGTYETVTEITGWSDPQNPITSKSSFEIVRGIGGAPCPQGAPGFNPGFTAGSLNNNAGSYSPFYMRLTRSDGEQNLTKFSSVLPPGVVAKIAGVEKCSEAQIAAAKGKTGRAELASPSCPANSQIGRSLAGAGVGSVLTYVPGKIYLAGPWEGAPLSVVAITPAVAGPFDVGTVVVREALTLDPITAEVHVDGEKSDPIPHILKGIPLKLRDLRVYVDRDKFTINPTSCDPFEVKATLFGSFLDVFSPADDVPVALASRYQAANCARLGFKPHLKINLKGGATRGAHPALRAVFRPRPGDANLARTVVKLPRSAFLDQAHIRTICTRVQFAQDACPAGAIYGKVTAFTPLLDEPLKGPAYLRSSNNKLPDLVFDLHGVVEIETSARIDSIRGGIRASFPFVPDAPLSKVIVEMRGGKKGLIVNSRNLCAGKRRSRADVKLDGHNGKVRDFRPVVRAKCRGKRR